MSDALTHPFKVGEWLIEPELLQMSNNGEVRKLEFRTMEILRCFVLHQGEVISKKKLHNKVWTDVYVTDNALTRAISRLRKAFDDDPLHPTYIETISKSGYRLIASVEFLNETDKRIHSNISQSTKPETKTNSIWMLVILFVLLITGISFFSYLFNDKYNNFYDPIPVSTLIGPERGHAISPDGEKMSFSYSEPNANNSDVYIKLLNDLSQIKFTDLESHQGFGIWSPDGNYMAYVSTENGDCAIYKEPSFGGEKTRIGNCYLSPRDFVWSPDGKTIAFTDAISNDQSRRIFFLNIESQKSEEMLSIKNDMSDRSPSFSPDGKYLVFKRVINGRGDIYRMRISDKEVTRLTFDNSRILGLDIFDQGKQIAFSSDRGGTWGLWKLPFDGGEITRFHINDRIPVEPKFAADGKRMIYKSIRDQTWIWMAKKDSSKYKTPIQVAPSTRAEIHPSLSSDGDKVTFLSNRSGYFEIWTHDYINTTTTKLTSLEGSYINMPSWSPDGSEIVFDARINEDNALYIIDVTSKMIRPFVNLKEDQVNAHYSSDGTEIYFASNHSGSWQIWKKSAIDTSKEIEQITYQGGYYLQEGPDDGYLYYSRFDTSGIWRMEEGGKEQEEPFIANLNDIDWGNWVPTKDGIIFVDRSFGVQIFQQSYTKDEPPVSLFIPSKRVQSWNPSLSSNFSGSKIICTQIENSEDEIMMVDFK